MPHRRYTGRLACLLSSSLIAMAEPSAQAAKPVVVEPMYKVRLERNLRIPMREGATDQELERLIRANVWAKWEGHKINHPDFERPDRSMSMIAAVAHTPSQDSRGNI